MMAEAAPMSNGAARRVSLLKQGVGEARRTLEAGEHQACLFDQCAGLQQNNSRLDVEIGHVAGVRSPETTCARPETRGLTMNTTLIVATNDHKVCQ
jgi:hypothetical protein